jgi:hypothetical protein
MIKFIYNLFRIFPQDIRRKCYKEYLNFLWSIYYKEYLKIIYSNLLPDEKLINKLVYYWGNMGWSAKTSYIETLIKYANNTNKLILECGSGLSTLIIGPIAKKRRLKMISFEHNDYWANRVQSLINKYKLNYNDILLRPLVNYGNFYWYDIKNVNIPEIGLCICDGPPGGTYGGRKGFLYLFKSKVISGTAILVDDTNREEEKSMIKEWNNICEFDSIIPKSNGMHTILIIK